MVLKLGEELEVAATDGFQWSIHQPGIPLSGGETGHLAIVPGDAVRVLGTLWRKGDKPPDIDAARIARPLAPVLITAEGAARLS